MVVGIASTNQFVSKVFLASSFCIFLHFCIWCRDFTSLTANSSQRWKYWPMCFHFEVCHCYHLIG
jgi:hypothetical protein